MDIINFNLRLPEDLNDEIVRIAKEEGRSKNKQIEQILKEYVKGYNNRKENINISQNFNNKAIMNFGKDE